MKYLVALLVVSLPVAAIAQGKLVGPPNSAHMYYACKSLQTSSSLAYDDAYRRLERQWRPEHLNKILAYCASPQFRKIGKKK